MSYPATSRKAHKRGFQKHGYPERSWARNKDGSPSKSQRRGWRGVNIFRHLKEQNQAE